MITNIEISLLIAQVFGLILTLFCSLFKKEKINKIISIVVSILIGILYCAQIIYVAERIKGRKRKFRNKRISPTS